MASITISLSGRMADKYGQSFTMSAESGAEALRGIASQSHEFKRDLEQSNWRLIRSGVDVDVSDFSLIHADSAVVEYELAPVVGGGKSGAGKIIGGAALITAAYFSGGLAAGAAGLVATAAHAGVAIGISMMLTGTSQLLTKTPKTKSSDSTTNYNFNGPVNTSGQGSAIPKVIGLRVLAGSVVASAEVTTES